MKLSDTKHNHSLTTILKSCLFGLIMILPFLAILPSTLYFAFNEHAQNYTHEEVIETYEYETNEVNSIDDLVVGNIYKAVINSNDFYFNQNFIELTAFYYNGDYAIYVDELPSYRLQLSYFNNNNDFRFTFFDETYTYGIYLPIGSVNDYQQLEFYFVYYNTSNYTQYLNISASDYLGEKNVEVVSSEQSPLNAFNTASNNVWNMPIFNWVNSGLGSIAIANMLSVFGIAQNTFISNILIYWLSITAIYIIIDIIITAFTILTHLITKKAE